jgi:hypothetical protein
MAAPSCWEMHPCVICVIAPPHYTSLAEAFLSRQFPGRWIGRGRPITWPPRSSDFTSLDFFLWGVHKGRVIPNEGARCEQIV